MLFRSLFDSVFSPLLDSLPRETRLVPGPILRQQLHLHLHHQHVLFFNLSFLSSEGIRNLLLDEVLARKSLGLVLANESSTILFSILKGATHDEVVDIATIIACLGFVDSWFTSFWWRPSLATFPVLPIDVRGSEERRVGKECSEPCRSRWSPYH